MLFISFMQWCGETALEEILLDDLDAFIEHKQDLGLKIPSVCNRAASLHIFLRFLIKSEIAMPEALS